MPLSLPDAVALACDLGTTTIAVSLLDAATGERLAAGGALNSQRPFGADVVTRLAAAVASPDTRAEMARLVNAELESLARRLLADAGVAESCLKLIAIAGNPTMEHLLLDLPVDSLAHIPYRPLFREGRQLQTRDLGWSLTAGLYLFPLPGGFVGGDLVAFLYGEELSDAPPTTHAPRLYLDLGTNAEIALCCGDRVFATSAAAGPAFEGGNLSCGMAALPGAIALVECSGGKVRIETIGKGAPTGVCGSGALSAVVSLRREEVIDASGRLRSAGEIPSNLGNRIVERADGRGFVLYRDARHEVVVSQEDIRQIQLAKGAIRAGVEVLLARAGLAAADLAEVVVTGSFGMVLGAGLLRDLGVIPHAVPSVRFGPDGALAGVERYLCREDGEGEVAALSSRLAVVPLSGNPQFEAHFIRFMDFTDSEP